MKKWLLLLLAALFIVPCALAENWTDAPVITTAYELSPEKLYLEWTGDAPIFQVYMDGTKVTDVIVRNAVIPVKKGTHTISVYPISETKSADTNINVGVNVKELVGGSISVDLGALGLDPKKLTAGTPSAPLNIDYVPDALFNAAPDKPAATTDFDNRVILSFTDRYNADEYVIAIKAGNDVNYVRFNRFSEDAEALITKANTSVTLTLEPAFLQSQGCMVPELDSKYTFTVQLRKYAENMLNGQDISTVIHESKESGGYAYTPTAAWKAAPVITYASQTADGQITLEWTHNDNGLGCEYAVMKLSKALIIQTGEEQLGVTTENTYTVKDLMNGGHVFTVVPLLGNEKGASSQEANVQIQNDWVAAPSLKCEAVGSNQVRLSWAAAEGVESYHITVSAGDHTSVLRFVDLDFSNYSEFDLPSTGGEMSHLFTYEKDIDPVEGQKLKFEIYGLRHAASGQEQKTAVTSQTLIIGK